MASIPSLSLGYTLHRTVLYYASFIMSTIYENHGHFGLVVTA